MGCKRIVDYQYAPGKFAPAIVVAEDKDGKVEIVVFPPLDAEKNGLSGDTVRRLAKEGDKVGEVGRGK